MWRVSISFFLLGAFLMSCSPKMLEGNIEKVKRKKTSELLMSIDSLAKQDIYFFYGKMSTKFSDTNRNISFKTSVRLNCDTAMSALITYASIPVASTLLTTDSLIITNKREKCFIKNDMAYLKDNFGVDFSFRNVQELFLGIPLDYDTTQKYFQIHEPYRYVVSSHRKRFIKRLDKKEEEKQDIVVEYFLSSTGKQLDGMKIISPSDTASIYVRYLSREDVDGYQIPKEIGIEIFTPGNHIQIDLDYVKSEINQPQPLYFTIPESYEQCP